MLQKFWLPLLVVLLTALSLVELKEEMRPMSEGKKPCDGQDHRNFDFWLGKWKVTTPSRPKWRADSEITLGNHGCSIHEAYKTPQGYAGTSVNFYDRTKKQWHQTWVDNQGNPLYLNGNFDGNNMVLSDGKNEITWTPLEDGRVRQHWQVIEEDGETKKTAFDGYYERVAD